MKDIAKHLKAILEIGEVGRCSLLLRPEAVQDSDGAWSIHPPYELQRWAGNNGLSIDGLDTEKGWYIIRRLR